MSFFPWLPIGTQISPDYHSGSLLKGNTDYQLISLQPDDQVALILPEQGEMSDYWLYLLQPMRDMGRVIKLSCGQKNYYIWLIDKAKPPILIDEMWQQKSDMSRQELIAFVLLMKALPPCNWSQALYLPTEKLCLPLKATPESEKERQQLIVRLITGGIADLSMSASEISKYNPWLSLADINEILALINNGGETSKEQTDSAIKGQFKLAGHPDIERFLNEHVVDYFKNKSHYQAMGVTLPNGILFYGPPGTGKTYTANKFAEFLGWHVRQVDLGQVGSAYIHQTGLRLRQEFDLAAKNAPTILIMDELDAMGSDRNQLEHHYQVEEMSELLRQLESAAKRNILVIGTTNRLDALDPALLRKGRFDYHLQVDYADINGVIAILNKELSSRPCENDLNINQVAAFLQRRPISDIAWFINEACRIAVQHKCNKLNNWCLQQAIKRL